ncbi:hypothetical protein LTR86_007412 [Recurvomyces mirabilis]|nr:hypothetical protein LTR86_007412 [Recurvomyces mirabilis]
MFKVIVNARKLLPWALGAFIIIFLIGAAFTSASTPFTPLRKATSHALAEDGKLGNIQNATLGFEKIFVISLPSRSDHRDAVVLASHLTGLAVDIVDGITHVDDKAQPPGAEKFTTTGALGAWRAHMNTLQMVVKHNTTSALIMEDDTDWDIRIKSQMQNFARASRLLLQPVSGTAATYLDPTILHPEEALIQGAQTFDIAHSAVPQAISSPYGDVHRWDLLWLGHCGASLPRAENRLPLGRVSISADETVPEKHHLDTQLGDDQLIQQYSDHTRVVSRAFMNTCSSAYAVSLQGARRILYELAIRRIDKAMDLSLQDMCDGTDGRPGLTCLSVLPQLFQQHRPIARKSSFSDIDKRENRGLEVGEEDYNTVAFSRNIRWSTRGNFRQLVYGDTNYTDLFPDGMARPDLVG